MFLRTKQSEEEVEQIQDEHSFPEIRQTESTNKLEILGQANPIYRKRNDQDQLEYDIRVGFKVLPNLKAHEIANYIPFKILAKRKRAMNSSWRKSETSDSPYKQSRCSKYESEMDYNPIWKCYNESQIIYQKYDNSKHNKFKDVPYFAGLFVPINLISKRLRDSDYPTKYVSIFQKILQPKTLNTKSQKYIGAASPSPDVPTPPKVLTFSSNFQSGNLFSSFQIAKHEYDLVLSNDINSLGSTQWFYFSVEGMESHTSYTFNIINFTKRDSLFNYGMKPAFYSLWQNNGVNPNDYLEGTHKTVGWFRNGSNVCYYRGEVQRENSSKHYYVLTFTITWKQPNDRIYLAHSFPYTSTRIRNLLKSLTITEPQKPISALSSHSSLRRPSHKTTPRATAHNPPTPSVSVEAIKYGRSVGGQDLLAFRFSLTRSPKRPPPKQAIIIMARQHPGETQGSFVCEGIIGRLVENPQSRTVEFLLQNYLVYVLPMVNPDGVDFGSYRSNLSGKDLNRKWDTDQPSNALNSLTPQVSTIKEFLNGLTTNKQISIRFVLDLHGHSKKLNSFFYGNPCPESPESVRMFPYMCSRFSEAVQYMDCTFASERQKKKAARVHLSSLFKQIHIYTFECSFYGYNNRQGQIIQFTPTEYMKLGRVIVNSLYFLLIKDKEKSITSNPNPPKPHKPTQGPPTAQSQFLQNSLDMYKRFQAELKESQQLMKVGEDDSSGSQSKPEDGELNNEEIVFWSKEEIEELEYRLSLNVNIVKKEKNSAQTEMFQSSKFIRSRSYKQTHNSLNDNKQRLNKHFKNIRNKKLATISQVNGVPDKYLISLLPISKISDHQSKLVNTECQTRIQNHDRFHSRLYKLYENEQQNNLVNVYCIKQTPKMLQTATTEQKLSHQTLKPLHKPYKPTRQTQPKKHSQIIAEIERQRHFREGGDRDVSNRRRLSHAINLKSATILKEQINTKKEVSVQTTFTFNFNPKTKDLNATNGKHYEEHLTERMIGCESLFGTQCSDKGHECGYGYENEERECRRAQSSFKEMLNIHSLKNNSMKIKGNYRNESLPEKTLIFKRSK